MSRASSDTTVGHLINSCLGSLGRWAHGRLPRFVRAACDTADIVQQAVLNTLSRMPMIQLGGRRALAAYLRSAVRNRIRDEHRRFRKRGAEVPLTDDDFVDGGPSPLHQAIAAEDAARYRAALGRLDARDRELIVAHVEMEYSHEQLACMTGRTRNAARMALQRAIQRLMRQMQHG